jgi:hypothetical protein
MLEGVPSARARCLFSKMPILRLYMCHSSRKTSHRDEIGMKKSEEKRIPELAEFDQSVSLYQLIPAGTGKGLSLLKKIVDYILTAKPIRIPSVLITGGHGIRTHASAFLRALGLEDTREMDGFLLQPCSSLIDYFRNPSANTTGYIITGAHQLDAQVQVKMSDILNRRKFNMFNFIKEAKETYGVEGVLVLTAPLISMVPESIRRAIDYHVAIEQYTHQQQILAVLQRLKYCALGYESEQVLEEITLRGNGNIRQMVQLIQICITLISTDGRTEIELRDVKKAADLLPPTILSKS